MKDYRLFTIHKFPNLKTLDFQKVKESERIEANKLFGDIKIPEKVAEKKIEESKQEDSEK